MSIPSLPSPWRLVFPGLLALEGESPLYARLSLLSDGGLQALSPAIVKIWRGEQPTGTFTADLSDGRQITASFGFVGTHDGKDFLWADANPSIGAALAAPSRSLRAALPPELAALTVDRPRITLRDLRVLTALAVEATGAEMGFTVQTNGRAVALVLTNLRLSRAAAPPDTLAKTPRPGVLARLFGKAQLAGPVKAVQALDAITELRQMMRGILNQGQLHLLPDARLREMEPQMRRAHSLLQAGDAATALQIVAELMAQMGEHREDQEPTGWLSLCEGMAAAALGDPARAEAAFAVAARAIQPPPATLLRLAKARIAQDPAQDLQTAWMQSPADFAALATAEEIASVAAALQATRSDDEAPETVLRQVIAALCEIEKTAFARSQAAAKHRSARHQLCPEDAAAEIATNRDYLDLLMTWATPGRAPTMGSYSGHPERDPSKMGQINPEASISDEASFIVTFSKLPTSYCYVLRRLSLLTQPPLWRLDQIIAMMDGETFRVF